MIDKDILLERLTTDHILTLMAEMGEYPFKTNDEKGEVWFRTVCHNGDSHKLCYYTESKQFHCYTNCGSLSVYNFFMQVKSINFKEVLVLLGEKVGMYQRKGLDLSKIHYEFIKEMKIIDKYRSMRNSKKIIDTTPLKAIESLPHNDFFENNVFYKGWIDEGIRVSTMQYFGIKWYESSKAIIIPHSNIDGEVIGIRRRSLLKEDEGKKYMPLILEGVMYTHPLNMNFYGLFHHKKGIQKFKKVMIVESEKSVLLAHEFYGSDAFVIATCGFNISNWHRDVLLDIGVEEVILGFDKDFDINYFESMDDENNFEYKKFEAYVKRVQSLANKLSPYFRTYVIWDRYEKLGIKDSPFDCGKDNLEFLMKNKIEITTESE